MQYLTKTSQLGSRVRRAPFLAVLAIPFLAAGAMGSAASAGTSEDDIQIGHDCTDYSPFPDGYVTIEFDFDYKSADYELYSAYVKPAANEWPDEAPSSLDDYESRKYEAVRSEPAGSPSFDQIEMYTLDENGLEIAAIVDSDLRDIVTGAFDVRVVRDDLRPSSDGDGRKIVAEETVVITCIPNFIPPRISIPTTTVPKALPQTGNGSSTLMVVAPLMMLIGGSLLLAHRRLTRS